MELCVESKQAELVELCREYRVRSSSSSDQRQTAGSTRRPVISIFSWNSTQLLAGKARCYFGLLFGLEDLLGRKVDLVDFRAIQNPYFLRSINKDRVVLYAA